MTTELTRTDRQRQLAIERTLKYLGLEADSIEAQALVLVCKRYSLDPLLGHIDIIKVKGGGTKIYVSRDGMLEVAHRSGVFDGITVDEERRNSDNDGWTAYVSVWRKDMAHPFRYGAQCQDSEPQAKDGNGPAMALARAERRALRRAFNIPVADDIDEPPPVEVDHYQLTAQPGDQRRRCSCGQSFGTDAEFAAHKTPGPVPPAPPVAGPAKRRRDEPPQDLYDNLPEARGLR
jgi:hypothetical protein